MSESDLDYIIEVYGDGDCGIFACALSEVTGLQPVLFRLRGEHALHLPDRWPRHAAVALPDGDYLDAHGISAAADVCLLFESRMSVDRNPDLRAYPFQSALGGQYFDEEGWQHACRLAVEMLEGRGLGHLLKEAGIPAPAL